MSASRNSSFLASSSLSGVSATPLMNNSSSAHVPDGCVLTEAFQFIPWDNEDNIVSKQVDDIIKTIFTGICLPLLFILSLCTNIINLVVFYKHGLSERINACLFTLSLVDLLSLTATYGVNGDILYMFIIGKGSDVGPVMQIVFRYYLGGLYGLVTSSQMVYTIIAAERCLCVTRPLLVKHFMPTKTTVFVLWTMTIVITGGYVVVCGVRYSPVCVYNPLDSSIFTVNYPKDFYFRHQFIMDILYSYIYGLFFPGISFISVVASTVVTAIKLKKLSKWRESVSSASGSVTSRDIAVTRVIIGTSTLFIVCLVPAIVMRASFLIFPELKVGGRHDNMAWVMIRLYMFASAVNNTFNFFIYYACGSRFRETTHRLFSLCCSYKNPKDKIPTSKTVDRH